MTRKIFDQDDETWELLEEYRVKHGQRSLNAALGLMICNSKEGKPFTSPEEAEAMAQQAAQIAKMFQKIPGDRAVPPPDPAPEIDITLLRPLPETPKPNPWAGVIGPTKAAPGSRLKQPKGKRK